VRLHVAGKVIFKLERFRINLLLLNSGIAKFNPVYRCHSWNFGFQKHDKTATKPQCKHKSIAAQRKRTCLPFAKHRS